MYMCKGGNHERKDFQSQETVCDDAVDEAHILDVVFLVKEDERGRRDERRMERRR